MSAANNIKDIIKNKAERKALKRARKESKLLKKIEKENAEKEAVEAKRRKIEEDEHLSEKIGRKYTVSLALPGSIMDNAQTPELRTYLAGQIARTAVIFNIDEIVIFDETGTKAISTDGEYSGVGKKGSCNVQMARILQYLECPQYLRKAFFPQHKDLQYAGLLNPLDCVHHVKADQETIYREGVVLNVPVREGKGSLVDVGLRKRLQIDKTLPANSRVTVKVDTPNYISDDGPKKLSGHVVSPTTPRTQHGLYWGYQVRLASSIGGVFAGSPYPEGYDLMIGTSERGSNVDDFTIQQPFRHLLVVFGGVQGLEASLDADQDIHIDDPALLFQHYLNTCPNQGSHTIRTEEALLISLSILRPKIEQGSKLKS